MTKSFNLLVKIGMRRMEDAATKQDASSSKHRVSSYVGPCEFMCESESRGEKPLLASRAWKENKPFTCRHYELMTSEDVNPDITERTLGCVLRREQRDSTRGCC